METFTEPMEFVEDPLYGARRAEALAGLDPRSLDPPMRGIVEGFAGIPHCFTLQSCCGHFVFPGNMDPCNLNPLPPGDCGAIRYRIAYIAFCIENSPEGRSLRDSLERVPAAAPEYIQFCSVDWFRCEYPNNYALQVEPYRMRFQDEATLEHAEALRVQRSRDVFLKKLEEVLRRQRTR
ncbi:MAG: hypothetical protein PHQ19_02345 [Candidatus Krumholzibacteria bacterium]|nr:hypothetical protein [Candidatus Krumholzibacteria bacterium]